MNTLRNSGLSRAAVAASFLYGLIREKGKLAPAGSLVPAQTHNQGWILQTRCERELGTAFSKNRRPFPFLIICLLYYKITIYKINI